MQYGAKRENYYFTSDYKKLDESLPCELCGELTYELHTVMVDGQLIDVCNQCRIDVGYEINSLLPSIEKERLKSIAMYRKRKSIEIEKLKYVMRPKTRITRK